MAAKKRWIEENEMVIIRCHDVLDKIGEYGIPFAFGRALGFSDSDLLRSRTYYNVYRVETQPAIAIDDSINTWTQTTFAEDSGRPLVVVNHGSSEEFGMKELSVQLNNALDQYETLHFKQGCSYRWLTA